jgi:hypothetical protein
VAERVAHAGAELQVGLVRRVVVGAAVDTYTATGADSARVRIISAREVTRYERRQYEMGTQATPLGDDMSSEIDFSKGTWGKFHRPGLRANLPIYLYDQVQATLAALAHAKGIELSALVNDPAQGHRVDRGRVKVVGRGSIKGQEARLDPEDLRQRVRKRNSNQ